MRLGVFNDESITEIQVLREDEVLLAAPVDGGAFIIQTDDVGPMDTVYILDPDSNIIIARPLM